MFTRRKILAFGLLVSLAVLVGLLADARARRARARPVARVREAAARVLGMPDLVLSSSSRWLRHPTQTEPGAPFADAPASLDVDPGGAVVGPPRALYGKVR